MTQADGVTCMVCLKQRAPGEIYPRQSRLIKGNRIYICSRCDAAKKEPRAYIILVAQMRGFQETFPLIEDYIIHHRYEGEPITGRELMGR